MIRIVLVQPEIPHNTGAIGRLCAGLDAALHLIRPLGFHLTDRWIKRAGLDYWQHLDLTIHDDWDAFLAAQQPARLCFASTRGKQSLYDCRFTPDDWLVFGNESSGLPEPFYTRYRDSLFRIPMPGTHARSLNLANAVAVCAYEAYRRNQTADHRPQTGAGATCNFIAAPGKRLTRTATSLRPAGYGQARENG